MTDPYGMSKDYVEARKLLRRYAKLLEADIEDSEDKELAEAMSEELKRVRTALKGLDKYDPIQTCAVEQKCQISWPAEMSAYHVVGLEANGAVMIFKPAKG